jgi:SagB-type dehydrogenase family enzyme
MINRQTELAWRYHNGTKHSPLSVRSSPHYLDWGNMPLPFKVYPSLEPIPLPREAPQTGTAALSAISENARSGPRGVPNLNDLALLLYFSAGITRYRKYPGGEIYFRAAACTGALYEIELYLICRGIPELEPGLYHFAVAEFGLRKLRAGDYSGVLAESTENHPAIGRAPLTIVCSGIYWRNAWKYQARTWRHFGWDNGTLLSNLMAMSSALRFPAQVLLGFQDDIVNRLIDADTEQEVALSLVPIGNSELQPPEARAAVEPLGLDHLQYSARQVDYPAMREAHAASALASSQEVQSWHDIRTPDALSDVDDSALIPLRPLAENETPSDPIERVILRRGSTRQFGREAISFPQLSTMLERATRGFPADFHSPGSAQLNHMYLIVNAVEDLEPGAYYFHRDRRALQLLKAGEFRAEAAYLGLDQQLPGDAAVNIFFLADLNVILQAYGNRGYRAVQLEAGVLGGKLYLAAYALRLGASGLTFYDDDVVQFFSPHAGGKSAIFLTCLGKSARQKTASG